MRLWIFLAVVLLPGRACAAALIEEERLAEYNKRNYTWPLTAVNPNTEGWKRRMLHRLSQVERIKVSSSNRYNGFMTTMLAAITSPHFTESGWGLARAPPDILQDLQESLRNGLLDAEEENYVDSIDGAERPLFIHQHELNDRILTSLLPQHEEWAGVPLVGSKAYGLRVYRNSSRLLMHVDKPDTHVISCILHVDHSEDSEPWPIYMEDFQGNTNEVVLEAGDMLFYESSKCFHGRPKRFEGSWYSSLFVHYRPRDWDLEKTMLETHYAIPPHWDTAVEQDKPDLEEVQMIGSCMIEPDCPEQWCGTKDTVKWNGPGIEGKVISTGFQYEDIVASNSGGDEL
jgi:hypothetical protein